MSVKKPFNLTAIIKDKKGNILSIGKNNYFKSHPLMTKLASKIGKHDTKKIFIHAEIDAIIKCKNFDKAYSIEIYRLDRTNSFYMPSRPCIICATSILETPIRKIIYCDDNKEFEETNPKDLLEYWKLKKK